MQSERPTTLRSLGLWACQSIPQIEHTVFRGTGWGILLLSATFHPLVAQVPRFDPAFHQIAGAVPVVHGTVRTVPACPVPGSAVMDVRLRHPVTDLDDHRFVAFGRNRFAICVWHLQHRACGSLFVARSSSWQ